MSMKIKKNASEYQDIHELYKNNNGTYGYIGELYKNNPAYVGLPSGYTQLDYIEGTGLQYLDTTKQASTANKTRFVVDFKYNEIPTGSTITGLFGRYGGSNGRFNFGYLTGSISTRKFAFDFANVNASTTVAFDTNRHTIDLRAETAKCFIDGADVTVISSHNDISGMSGTIWLFKTNSNGNCVKANIYRATMYEDTTKILDLIPAMNSSNVAGMYDLVSETFFTNLGTGTFIAGAETPKAVRIFDAGWDTQVSGTSPLTLSDARAKATSWEIDGQSVQDGTPIPSAPIDVNGVGDNGLPSEYKRLQYIKGDGTAYIDTGYIPTLADNIEVKYNAYQASGSIAVCGGYGGSNYYLLHNANGIVNVRFGGTNRNAMARVEDAWHTFNITDRVEYFDGNLVGTVTGSAIPSCNAFLFSRNTGSASNYTWGGKIAYYKAWRNGSLIKNLIPAQRISDSVLGMYDKVTSTFYTNANSSGSFTAGQEEYIVPVLKAENCGSYTFAGNETSQIQLHNWRPTDTTYAVGFKYSLFGDGISYGAMVDTFPVYCNSAYLPPSSYSNLYGGSVSPAFCYYTGATNQYSLFVRLPKTIATSSYDVVNWLKGKTFYYQRTTDATWVAPTTTNINIPSQLQKVGDYKDFAESDGSLTKNVCVKVLTGTESIVAGNTGTNYSSWIINGITGGINGQSAPRCTHLTGVNASAVYSQPDNYPNMIVAQTQWTRVIISIPNSLASSTADVQSWLAEQYSAGTPVTIYYPLASPTETSVDVPTISTSKGTNIVSVDTSLSPSNVSVTYRKKHR